MCGILGSANGRNLTGQLEIRLEIRTVREAVLRNTCMISPDKRYAHNLAALNVNVLRFSVSVPFSKCFFFTPKTESVKYQSGA